MKQIKQRYLPFAKSKVLEALAFGGRFYLFFFSRILSMIIAIFLWLSIYNSSSSTILGGFSVNEMIIYQMISFITADLLYIGVLSEIGQDIREGTIIISLVKPINYMWKLLASTVGDFIYKLIFPGLLVFIGIKAISFVCVSDFNIGVDLLYFVMYLMSMVLGLLIVFFIDFCFGMIAIYSKYVWGLNVAKNALLCLLSGKIIPLSFFPSSIRTVLSYFPFTYINYFPSIVFIGKIELEEFLFSFILQILWVICLFYLSKCIWHIAKNHLLIFGG